MSKTRAKRIDDTSDDDDEAWNDQLQKAIGKKSVSWAADNQTSDEVLAFDDDSEGSDEDPEIDLDEEEDLSGAWGTSRKAFYNEDVNADDEDAKLEEQEATQIQKKYFDMLEKKDFGLDLFESKRPTVFTDQHLEEQSRQRHIVLPSNLLDLSANARLQLLRDQYPEIEKLSLEYKTIFDDLKIYLLPFVQLVIDTSSLEEFEKFSGWQFVLAVLELYLVYSSYLSLYLTMKSIDPTLSRHPIENEIEQYQKLSLLIQDDFQQMKSDLLKLCEILQERKSHMKTKTNGIAVKPHLIIPNGGTSLRERMAKRREVRQVEETQPQVAMEEEEEDDEEEDRRKDKRAITYQMEKNKGLTVRRKKEYRNPRVRHRNKYARALVKRKSRVPTARNENEKYIGEPTGIRAGIKRGIKLRS